MQTDNLKHHIQTKMKYVLTIILLFFLPAIVFTQASGFKLLDSKFHYESSESKTYFKVLISFEDTTCYVEGNISFDDEGKTIQKAKKFKKGVAFAKIEDAGYVSMSKDPFFENYEGIAFIQFKNIEGNKKERIKKLIARLDNELMLKNAGVNNDLGFDKGVGIAEYFLQDTDVAFQTIYGLLKEEGMLDEVLLGQRVYMDGDDYNVLILYPLNYEGTFWAF